MFPVLEPEFTCPAIAEHGLFTDTLEKLEKYLEDVLGWEKDAKGVAKRVEGKTRVPYDAEKIQGMIEEFVDPLFSHVSVSYCGPS